jgi:hypothetical protein
MGELITGRAPFQGQDSEDQLCAIVGFVNGGVVAKEIKICMTMV